MEFSEKLNYLFELSHAEGKELAAEMNITPPQISKMRSGSRGLPKDINYARVLARFFAHRCGNDYQLDAIAKAMKIAQVRNVDSEDELTDILLDWLSDENDPDDYATKKADEFLQKFGTLTPKVKSSVPVDDTRNVLSPAQSNFFAYYGGEGRRRAVQTFFSYLIQRTRAYTINILTDENIDWVTEVSSYSKQLQASMMRLTEQGCVFRRISGPITDIDQAFESLNRWFPLYMTGKATSYYYKRMRDSLNRITIFSVPDVAVLFSFSVGRVSSEDMVTFFTIDENTVNRLSAEFDRYLSVCEPIMNSFRMEETATHFYECMVDYEACKGSCIQKSNSLSLVTLPWDVATSLNFGRDEEKAKEFLNFFARRHKQFQSNLASHQVTDIIRLADINDILNGKVPISAVCLAFGRPLYYTPTAYLLHLQNILYILKHNPNYNVVLRSAQNKDVSIVYVKEGFRVILAREVYPFSVFEVSERFLVDAFAEYLRRLVPTEQNRRAVIKEIEALIEQLIICQSPEDE